jgi:hypothetical protein
MCAGTGPQRSRKQRMKLIGGSAWTKQRAWTLGAVAAVALLTAGVATADTGPLLVSGADPYAACTVGAPGFSYPSAEAEPFVAVNPANTGNIVGVYQEDRWSNGGARGLVAAVSSDGGGTWSTVTLPFTACAGGLDRKSVV